MTTYTYTGAAIGNNKAVQVVPGPNANDQANIVFSLGQYSINFVGWNATNIANTWNASPNPFFQQILATVTGDASKGNVVFTHQTVGQDFELTVSVNGVTAGVVNTVQVFSIFASGGTFTLSDGTLTTGNITYNATPATLVANMQAAINALAGYSVGDVVVSYVNGQYQLTFGGRFAGTNVALWTANGANLTGVDANAVIATVQDGNAGQDEIINISFPAYGTHTQLLDEIQKITMSGTVTGGSFTISIAGYGTTAAIPFTAGRSVIKQALENMLGLDTTIVTGGPLSAAPTTSVVSEPGTETDDFNYYSTNGTPTAIDSTDPASILVSAYDQAGSPYSLNATVTTTTPGVAGTNRKLKLVCSANPTGTTGYLTLKATSALSTVYYTSSWTPTNVLANTQGWIDTLFGAGNTVVTGSLTDLTNGITIEFVNGLKSRTVGWTFLVGHYANPGFSGTTVQPFVTVTTTQTPVAGTDAVQTITLNVAPPDGTQVEFTFDGVTVGPYTFTAGTANVSDGQLTSDFCDAFSSTNVSGTSLNDNYPNSVLFSADYPTSVAANGSSLSWATTHALTVKFQGHGFQDTVQPLITFSSTSASSTIDSRAGYRFTLPIDNTFTLQAAKLTLTPTVAPTGTPTLTITAQKATDPAVPASAAAAFSATQTTAYVQVTVSSSTAITLDVKAIIAELIAQVGWASGQHVIFNVVDNTHNAGATFSGTAVLNTSVVSTSYTYRPATVEFTGALGGINLPQMTINSSLTGGGAAGVTTLQDGGSQTVNNITGGTWSLAITRNRDGKKFLIPNIPYNVTAATLQGLINGVMGAGSCTVTGGPAPGTALAIHFTGSFATTALNESLIVSLTGDFGTSAELAEIRPAQSPQTPLNIWDLTVIPGAGTLAVSGAHPSVSRGYLKLAVIVPGTNPVLDVGDTRYIFLPLYQISPREIQEAINESFGKDVCRVTRIVHSLEHISEATHPGVSTLGIESPLSCWYFRDVFRIVFVNDLQFPSSVSNVTVQFADIGGGNLNPAGPSLWMVTNTSPSDSDVDDMFYETERVYQLFTTMATAGTPVHLASVAQYTGKWRNNYSFRAKLIPQYASGSTASQAANGSTSGAAESDQNAFRVGLAKQFQDEQIQFQWCKHLWVNEPDQYPTNEVICSSGSVNWDAPASEIQTMLEQMLTGFFGPGNVRVTGGFYNSWLSEATIDDPDPLLAYSDLHIELIGDLAQTPLNETGFELRATITNPAVHNCQQMKNPLMWIEPYSKPCPGGRNQRVRFTLDQPASVTQVKLNIDGYEVLATPATTAQQLQDAITAAIGSIAAPPNMPVGDFAVGLPVPDRNRLPATVYGTDLTKPIDIEFTGFGWQYIEHIVSFGVFGNVSAITITKTQTGIDPISEVQSLTITGNPHAGTYTVNGSGNIAYNGDATAIQTAIGAPSGTIATVSGTYPNFLLTWPSSSGNVAQWTTTESLNNSSCGVTNTGSGTQQGGPGASVSVSDVTQGTGPLYFDSPQNYTPTGVPGRGDTLVIDDATSPICFGIDQSSVFVVSSTGADKCQHTRNRQVFQNNQKVRYTTTGTAPGGLTNGNDYYIINQANDYSFQLSATLGGPAIDLTTVGSGIHTLTTLGITINLYNRYSGNLIGLPNINATTELPEYLPRYLRLDGPTAVLGQSTGDGCGLMRLDTMNSPANIDVKTTGQTTISPLPALLLLFNNVASVLTQEDGDVGVAPYSNESSSFNTIDVSGGSILLHNCTIAGHANFTNGVKPTIEGTCTVAGTTLMD